MLRNVNGMNPIASPHVYVVEIKKLRKNIEKRSGEKRDTPAKVAYWFITGRVHGCGD